MNPKEIVERPGELEFRPIAETEMQPRDGNLEFVEGVGKELFGGAELVLPFLDEFPSNFRIQRRGWIEQMGSIRNIELTPRLQMLKLGFGMDALELRRHKSRECRRDRRI